MNRGFGHNVELSILLFYYIYKTFNREIRMTLLADLADTRAKRSKSAHKLAACVVSDPEAIVSMSTASLAALGG